jgi:hypothetical protein
MALPFLITQYSTNVLSIQESGSGQIRGGENFMFPKICVHFANTYTIELTRRSEWYSD